MNSGSIEGKKTPRKQKQLSIFEAFGKAARKRKHMSDEELPTSTCSKKIQSSHFGIKPETSMDNMEKDDKRPSKDVIILDEDLDIIDNTNEKTLTETFDEDIIPASPENCAILKKVNSKEMPKCKDTNSSVKVLSDSSNPTQEKDDLYEVIMADKREANNRLLKKEIVDDYSDLSQSTPPSKSPPTKRKVSSPAPSKENSVLNMYDSPDLIDTFPDSFDLEFDDEPVTVSWLGKPKSRLKVAPDCLMPLPDLKPSQHHTVLFDTSYFDMGPPPPSRASYTDAWDSDHVKLPCSPKSLFPTPQSKNGKLTNRWELIENALFSDIRDSKQLEEAILKYNVRFNRSFTALHDFCNRVLLPAERKEFFDKTLPSMTNLALSLPTILTQPIPLLRRQQSHCITLSQQQIACLLANAFLCTFPRRNSSSSTSEYASFPSINFNRIFVGSGSDKSDKSIVGKLHSIFHYFKRVTTEMPSGSVTFEHRVCNDFPVWNKTPCELCELHICKDGLIEDQGKGMLQMDFANKYVGGGVLGSGMVQEEILFSICPELIVSRLFTEVLDDNECLIIMGAERFSKYSGYANTFVWEGDYIDSNTRDSWRRKVSHILALDATRFTNFEDQFKIGKIRRELNKLYCGFRCEFDPDYSPAIATGNWGCGAFGGDPVLKALLQLMAAAVVGRDLCYFTFSDSALMHTIHEMYTYIKSSNLNVGQLWDMICRYNNEVIVLSKKQSRSKIENIFEYIKLINNDYEASTDEENSENIKSMAHCLYGM
ncbi:poly(ADP-ribose) glycohydrolase-like [Styela clava]